MKNEKEIDPSKTLLDLALEYSYEQAEKPPESQWSKHALAEAELALAYLDGVVKAEAVAHALRLPRNNISAWWPAALMKGLRHGFLEIRIKGSDKPCSSYAGRW